MELEVLETERDEREKLKQHESKKQKPCHHSITADDELSKIDEELSILEELSKRAKLPASLPRVESSSSKPPSRMKLKPLRSIISDRKKLSSDAWVQNKHEMEKVHRDRMFGPPIGVRTADPKRISSRRKRRKKRVSTEHARERSDRKPVSLRYTENSGIESAGDARTISSLPVIHSKGGSSKPHSTLAVSSKKETIPAAHDPSLLMPMSLDPMLLDGFTPVDFSGADLGINCASGFTLIGDQQLCHEQKEQAVK